MNFRITSPNSLASLWDVRERYYFPDETPEVKVEGEDSDEEEEEGKEIVDDTEEEEEEEEKKDDSDDDEDKESEKEELTLARVDYGAIKEKYPSFFKDFPELKHAFFREQQFTEIFPTIEDAKRAAERELAYEEITSAVIEGDVSKFLNELESENKDGLKTFAQNFLPALQKNSKELFYDVIGPTVQGFVRNVYGHGVKEKDDNIQNAAKIVHKILFGGGYDDIEREDGRLDDRRETKKEDPVDKDKQNYFAEKYKTLYADVTNACYTQLDSEISKGLEDLKKAKPGLHKIIAKDIKERILSEMDKDAAYLGRMQGLWKREQRSGFNGTLKSSLTTAFIAKAKTLVPKYRSEVRREVLGKEGMNGSNGNDNKEPNRLTGNRSSSGSGKGKMTPERQRAEKLTTRQVFDA